MPRQGSSPASDTLADQLGRAMAAVAVGSDDLEQLAAEQHRADGTHEVDPEYLQRNGLLGGGGYASVWLTTDTRTGRQRSAPIAAGAVGWKRCCAYPAAERGPSGLSYPA